MKINKLAALIIMTVLLLSFCACGTSTEQADGGVTVTDMIGREVEIEPGCYENVVCIGAGALRMYSYIGDTELLCGVEDIDNLTLDERPKMFDNSARPYVEAYGDVFAELPSCGVGGPNAQSPEAEKILGCMPDIVISGYEDSEVADALQQQLGIPVITLSFGPKDAFDESFAGDLRLLGTVFGKAERAEELIAFVESEKTEIEARVADIPEEERVSAYICGLGNWGTTNHLMTSQVYPSFTEAGVKNVLTDLSVQGVGSIEEEKFVALGEEMDMMFIDSAAVKNIQPLFSENPALFDTCRAWREGKSYLQIAYKTYHTNYELALANTWFIAKTAYPERFADIDMMGKLNEITKEFLGENLADDIFACPSSFGGYGEIDGSLFD